MGLRPKRYQLIQIIFLMLRTAFTLAVLGLLIAARFSESVLAVLAGLSLPTAFYPALVACLLVTAGDVHV